MPMKWIIGIIFIIVFVFLLSLSYFAGWASKTLVVVNTPELSERTILAITTQYRADHNLPALIESPELCRFAKTRVDEIVNNNDWSHDGFLPVSHAYEENFHYLGENLARNYISNDEVLTAWIGSPAHKENLDNKYYDKACVAIKDGIIVMTYGH